MERIFGGEIYDIIPQLNGIVFSYCKDKDDEHILVSYKMLSLDTGRITDVAKNIYQLSKFGSNYRTITTYFENHIAVRSIVHPNGKVFVCDRDGRAILFGNDGEPLWEGSLIYRGRAPSDIAFNKNSIWCCYSETNLMLRFNILTMREELRIGGAKSPFSSPKSLFVQEDIATVSNPESNKLIKVNLSNYEVEDYKEFTESVYAYIKVKDKEFVVMESGLYTL
ncbi:MAG: hypothetical protein IKK24_07450 [Clostridia bacterium]|nr:hypothetical protein [Clostridia bacterium]